MTDPIAAIGAAGAPHAAVFGNSSMRPPDGAGSSLRAAIGSLDAVGNRLFSSGSEGPASLLANVERAALGSITPADFLRTSLAATDLSVHVSMSMMKFHLSASLGSAATGLFNTLLKNRE